MRSASGASANNLLRKSSECDRPLSGWPGVRYFARGGTMTNEVTTGLPNASTH